MKTILAALAASLAAGVAGAEDRIPQKTAIMHQAAICPAAKGDLAEWCRFHPERYTIILPDVITVIPTPRPDNRLVEEVRPKG